MALSACIAEGGILPDSSKYIAGGILIRLKRCILFKRIHIDAGRINRGIDLF
jgi:hypothetical protein